MSGTTGPMQHVTSSLRRRLRRPQEMARAVSEFWLSVGDNIGKTFGNLEKGLHGWSEKAEAAMQLAGAQPMWPRGPREGCEGENRCAVCATQLRAVGATHDSVVVCARAAQAPLPKT